MDYNRVGVVWNYCFSGQLEYRWWLGKNFAATAPVQEKHGYSRSSPRLWVRPACSGNCTTVVINLIYSRVEFLFYFIYFLSLRLISIYLHRQTNTWSNGQAAETVCNSLSSGLTLGVANLFRMSLRAVVLVWSLKCMPEAEGPCLGLKSSCIAAPTVYTRLRRYLGKVPRFHVELFLYNAATRGQHCPTELFCFIGFPRTDGTFVRLHWVYFSFIEAWGSLMFLGRRS